MKLQLKNNAGMVKIVPTGLSWTGFFFTYFTMWTRGMIGFGFLWLFILSWIQCYWVFAVIGVRILEVFDGGDGSLIVGLINGICMFILGGFSFLFLFKMNRWTARHYLNRGFVPEGSRLVILC